MLLLAATEPLTAAPPEQLPFGRKKSDGAKVVGSERLLAATKLLLATAELLLAAAGLLLAAAELLLAVLLITMELAVFACGSTPR